MAGAGTFGRIRNWWAGAAVAEQGLTPTQRKMLAASRREVRLDEVVGRAPSPPTAPRGAALTCDTTVCDDDGFVASRGLKNCGKRSAYILFWESITLEA